MAEHAPRETRQALQALAQAQGYEVSDVQLANWHRAHLLPEPEQEHLGKGQGTRTSYAAGTGRQLLALCRIHARSRKLDDVAWQLWWEGYDVDPSLVGSFFSDVASEWDRALRLLRGVANSGLSALALSLIEKFASAPRFRYKPLAQARKRIGKGRFERFVRTVVEIGVGVFGEDDASSSGDVEEQARLFEKAVGLEGARTDRLWNAGPWLDGDTAPVLKELGQLLLAHPLSEVLRAATLADLSAARDECQRFMATFDGVGYAFEHFYGRGAFGFTALRTWFQVMGPWHEAMLVLIFVLFRAHGTEDMRMGMDVFRDLNPEAQTMLRPARMLEAARREIPAYAEILSPSKIRRALRYQNAMKALDGEIRRTRERHLSEVEAFFERHPEFKSEHTTAQEGGAELASHS